MSQAEEEQSFLKLGVTQRILLLDILIILMQKVKKMGGG